MCMSSVCLTTRFSALSSKWIEEGVCSPKLAHWHWTPTSWHASLSTAPHCLSQEHRPQLASPDKAVRNSPDAFLAPRLASVSSPKSGGIPGTSVLCAPGVLMMLCDIISEDIRVSGGKMAKWIKPHFDSSVLVTVRPTCPLWKAKGLSSDWQGC